MLLAHHVRLVARKITYGLFVRGRVDLVRAAQSAIRLRPKALSRFCSTHMSRRLMFYRILFEHRKGRVIWLDDCDSIYANLQVLGPLRSALWGQGERLVTYASSQLDDIPNEFVFESRIIFCANTIPGTQRSIQSRTCRESMSSI